MCFVFLDLHFYRVKWVWGMHILCQSVGQWTVCGSSRGLFTAPWAVHGSSTLWRRRTSADEPRRCSLDSQVVERSSNARFSSTTIRMSIASTNTHCTAKPQFFLLAQTQSSRFKLLQDNLQTQQVSCSFLPWSPAPSSHPPSCHLRLSLSSCPTLHSQICSFYLWIAFWLYA